MINHSPGTVKHGNLFIVVEDWRIIDNIIGKIKQQISLN